ncbi:MAG: diguanylate cyclase, partial [Clostridia bacterium]|nr:diguanylate cyclase [Clostridia bacterium]
VTGIKLEELRGKTPVEVAGSNEGATIEARYAECLKARQSIVYEETLNLKLGKQTWHTTLTPIFVNNKIVNLVGSCHDITKRKEIEEAVFNDRELLKTTLLSVDDGVISTDNLGNVIIFNQKAEQITGLVASDCIGKNLDDVLSITDEFGKKRYNITQQMLLNKKNEKIPAYLIVRTKKGKRILVEISISKIIQTDNNISGLVLAFRNYESKKIKEEKIKTLSNTDHLTKLYNRRYFEKETVKLNNSNVLPLSILMIDINGLKLINDAFGHKYGDIVLKQAANIFKNCCKNKGFAARVGGDEFVVVLPHCDEIDSKKIVNKINKNIEIKSKQNQKNLGVILSASIGLATKISKEQDMEEVFKEAEDNMYRYKLSESASIKSKTIDIILNTLYEKNKMEMYHSKRVSMLSYDIASKLDLGKEQINEIKLAGLMHDIGKIGVAETILNKTGPLTEIERAEINKHAEIGYRILKASNEFFKIAVYLLEHHERWDGKGYPNKLAGEQISLPARIIAVADAYDAMTSNRFYRNSLTKEQALKEILACSGKQFDPNIARIFVEKVLEEKWNIE